MARTTLKSIVTSAPTNAWLLMGDEASMPTSQELRSSRTEWRQQCLWTGPKQVQPGDLLFFYFIAPTKAVHFVARAATHPIFDPHEGVNSVRPVDPNQWWLIRTPLVPVAPVPFASLQRLHDGYLNLRGKPSHYLSPDRVGACPESRGTWVTIRSADYAAAPTVSVAAAVSGWACRCSAATSWCICL